MGLYDSIYFKTRCPYCGVESKMEFQTKDGYCFMKEYKVGDVFDDGQFRKVTCTGSCESVTCQLEAAKESVRKSGYWGGFSRNFDCVFYCDSKGRITNKMKILTFNYHKGFMNGKNWLKSFREDSLFDSKNVYMVLLYVFNIKDNEESFAKWFLLRHKLERMILFLAKHLKLSKDEELASVFLSNSIFDIIKFYGVEKD